MSRLLFVFVVLLVYVQVQCEASRPRCKHQVRTPTKCHEQGSCTLHARLTPYENSTLFYCCKDGYRSINNQCTDIDECAASPKPCEHTCHNHPGTYSCGCEDGFHYVDATAGCVKLTQCSQLNCSNSCFYEDKGPVCDCPRGYTLESKTHCVAHEKVCPTGYHMEYDSHTCRVLGDEPQMIFVTDGQAYEYSLRSRTAIEAGQQPSKLVTVTGVVNALYYDAKAKLAYFAGEYLTAYNFTSSVPVGSKLISLPSLAIGMAVDYFNGHIYVLDEASLGLWTMKDEELTSLGTLIEHEGSMTALAIDPGNAWLFYSSRGVVFKALLNGQKFSTLFRFYDHVPNEDVKTEVLAVDNIDRNEPFLFYGVNRCIFSFSIDGRNMLWVTDSLPGNVIFMDVFEDSIYYTMENVGGITSRTKDGLKAPETHLDGESFRAIYVNHQYRQLENAIWECSKKCAQVCFRDATDGQTCSCTSDYVLGQDKTSCVHVNATSYPSARLEAPSREIEDWGDSDTAVTTTTGPYNSLLLVACILIVSVCVVQSLLMWWFYPRRRYLRGLGEPFAARFHGSGSCVAFDSVTDAPEN